jgi:hypothetical protein
MRPDFTSSWSLPHNDRAMIPSYFQLQECALILSCLEDWEQLQGLGKEQDEHGELYSSKDRLVDEVIQELFEQFLERDSARRPESVIAFTREERDTLHTVCRTHVLEYVHVTPSIACQADLLQCQEAKRT